MHDDNEKNLEKWRKRRLEAQAFYEEGLLLREQNKTLEAIKLFYKAFKHTGHYEASYKVEAFCSHKDAGLTGLTRFHLDDRQIDADKQRPLNLEGTLEDIFYRGLLEYTGQINKTQPNYNVAKWYFEHIINEGGKNKGRENKRRENKGGENKWVKEAWFMMGVYYERMGDNIDLAFQYYEKAAKLGHSNALVRAGYFYEKKRYKNLSEAESAYRKAAEQYDVNACTRLANILGNKKCDTPAIKESNFKEMKRYLKQAVEGGDYPEDDYPEDNYSPSIKMLCYHLALEENYIEQMNWARKAARINPYNCLALKDVYLSDKIPLNESSIRNYVEDAALIGFKTVHDFLIRHTKKNPGDPVAKKCLSEFLQLWNAAENLFTLASNTNMTSTLVNTVPAQESFSLPHIPSSSPGRNRDWLFYQGQRYQRHEVDPDGDCGYTAFGITREDAFELILQNRQDERVHEVLVDLIVETLSIDENFENYLPANENLKNVKEAHRLYKACLTYTGRDRRALEEANAANLKKAVKESISELLAYYLKYDIVEKRVDFGWTHPLILFALAQIQKIPLRLWKLNERGEMIPHPQFPEYNPQNPKQEPTHLLFIHGNHFERLEMQDRVDERLVPPSMLQVNQSVNKLNMFPALRWKQKMLVSGISQPTKTPLSKTGNNRHILLSLVDENPSKNAKLNKKVRKVVKKTERPEEKEIDNNRQSQKQRRL